MCSPKKDLLNVNFDKLDVVFHKPRLLATVIFSLWWILFASTEGGSKSVAQTILTLASGRSVFELEDGLIQFTSVVVITVTCLMLFFVPRLCFAFNSVSALYKIILMVVIFVAGMSASRRANSGWDDFNVEYPGYNSKEVLTAMVYIIECYQGWDNANYVRIHINIRPSLILTLPKVSGEINDCKETLKWAGITTISILTCLNMLVTLAFVGSHREKLIEKQLTQHSLVYLIMLHLQMTRGKPILLSNSRRP